MGSDRSNSIGGRDVNDLNRHLSLRYRSYVLAVKASYVPVYERASWTSSRDWDGPVLRRWDLAGRIGLISYATRRRTAPSFLSREESSSDSIFLICHNPILEAFLLRVWVRHSLESGLFDHSAAPPPAAPPPRPPDGRYGTEGE